MSSHIVIGRGRITVILRMLNQDVAVLSPATDSDHNTSLSVTECTSTSDTLTSDVASRLRILNNGNPVPLSEGAAHIVSTDPGTSDTHELAFSLIYRLSDGSDFQSVEINPNLFREIRGRQLIYKTPPLGSQLNAVTIIDCDTVSFESKGTEVYRTTVGKCEPPGTIGTASPERIAE